MNDPSAPRCRYILMAPLRCQGPLHSSLCKWGLKDPSIFIMNVAKEVDIDLTLAGNLSSAG
jgi:hypothetical protein